MREGKRAADRAAAAVGPRRLATGPTARGDDRVLYVTTGYRLVALNAKTGAVIPASAKTASSI